jgi:peptidoglycan/xylan/chitin deacetylase (PgdA/CDA1 family)
VLFAGPDADPTGAIVVSASADLWVKITASSEVDAAKVERITVLGGGSVPVIPLDRGLPAGGTTGQVLTKASSNPYDAEWDTPSAVPSGGAGGALSGTYPNPGLNASAVESIVTASDAVRAAFVPKWKANTTYAAGEPVVNPSGQMVTANAAFTSGATYNAANWTVTAGGGGSGSTTDASLLTSGTLAPARIADGSLPIAKLAAGLPAAVTLTPTATKTAAYTVAVGELALMNVAGGATVLTLPAAPADKAQVGYRAIGATSAVPLTVNRGGSDTIGTAGATSAVVALADEVVVLQYQASSTRWLAVSNVKTQASLDAATKTALAPVTRRNLGVRGRIVLIWDDALLTQKAAASKIEAVGGKVNFAIPWSSIGLNGLTMVAADVTELYNRGHQIMCHSLTHPNMTTQTAAQRQAEWDTSKANLEAITAVGAITDFVYPNNASNLTTTQEAYGRYLRTYTAQNAPTVLLPGENGLHIGRNAWSTGASHQNFLAGIRRIAYTGETYVIFCHDVETAGTTAINAAMLDEAIALATSLGVQFVRGDEAFVGHQPLLDPSFESGDLTGIYNSITSVAAGSSATIVTDTPSAGLMGTKSLQMVNDGNGALNRVAMAVVNTFMPRTGEEYTLSGRIRQEKTSGTGGGQLMLRQWDEFGNSLGDTGPAAITTVGSTPWTQVSVAFTPNKLARTFSLWCYQTQMVGTTWYDHIHIAPTKYGVLG